MTIDSRDYIRWPGKMDDMSLPHANKCLNHKIRHYFIIHSNLRCVQTFDSSIEKNDGNSPVHYLLVCLNVFVLMAYTHQNSINPTLSKHHKVFVLCLIIFVCYRHNGLISSFLEFFLGVLDEGHKERRHGIWNNYTNSFCMLLS